MNNNINMPVLNDGSVRQAACIYKKGLLLAPILFLALTAMYSCKSNEKATTQAPATSMQDSLIAIHDTLQSQVNAARAQVDGLNTANSKLTAQISEKDAQIASLKKQLGHLTKSNKEFAARLNKEVKTLSSLKDEMSNKATEFAQRIGLLQSDRDNLAMQRDSLMQKYNALRELGSVLDASNFRLTALHLKHHGRKEKKTARARKADILRTSFDIDENRIAESGTKKLYLVITDPDGNLLSSTNNGSGMVVTHKGNSIGYSVLKEIPLVTDEPVKDVTVDWKQDADYKKGTYSIAVYNGGYRIGGGVVALN